MTKPATFRQSDVTRAIKAAQAADARVVVEIMRDGTIRLIPVDARDGAANSSDDALEAWRRRRAEKT